MLSIFRRVKAAGARVQKRIGTGVTPVRAYSKKHPFISFLLLLGVLLLVIIAGSIVRKPAEIKDQGAIIAKEVDVYRIGSVPRITTQARVEKSGVITISAQTAGIVQSIAHVEGERVTSGQTIISLATNYQGGNASAVSRQVAGANLSYQKETYDLQKDIIAKNREIAEKSDTNADELSRISEESKDRTEDIIDVSKSTLDLINTQINNAPSDDVKAQLQGQKINLLNGLSAAESALRTINYATDEDKAARQLSDVQKDVTLKQLELQEKTLALNLEITGLNYKLAQISEALMYPAAPFAGRIERIHVRVGEAVTPGTPLVTFSGDEQSLSAVALVSKDIASSIAQFEDSYISAGGRTMIVSPDYIAQEPTNGSLFAVVYHLSKNNSAVDQERKGIDGTVLSEADELLSTLTDGQYVSISLPVGASDSNAVFPVIPVDAVYQSNGTSIIFVVEDGIARSREIELGMIFGRYVEVREGLAAQDIVIINRNVIEGDTVAVNTL